MPSAGTTANNRRLLLASAVSFFTGLQVRTVIDLFGPDSIAAVQREDYSAWLPDDVGAGGKRIKLAKGAEGEDLDAAQTAAPKKKGGRKRRRNRKKKILLEDEGDPKGKPPRPPQKFNSMNYTNDFEPLKWSLPVPTELAFKSSDEFMAEYISTKRAKNIELPWEHKDRYSHQKISLPLPIISTNFPKSATLTMKHYFACGGATSIHTSTQQGRIGICMMENQFAGKPPLDGCDTHKDHNTKQRLPIDFISDIGLQGPPCYYASMHNGGLENIAKHYPNSTILMVTRNATNWARSIKKWGNLLHRWKKICGFDGRFRSSDHSIAYWDDLHEEAETYEEYWVQFYHAHTQKIREFAMEHLTMTYVEAELEDPDMAEKMERYTTISRECIMDCHPGPKWIKLHNQTSRCHPVGKNPALKATVVDEDSYDGDNDDKTEENEGNMDDDEPEMEE